MDYHDVKLLIKYWNYWEIHELTFNAIMKHDNEKKKKIEIKKIIKVMMGKLSKKQLKKQLKRLKVTLDMN
jgi:hypothetical protein